MSGTISGNVIKDFRLNSFVRFLLTHLIQNSFVRFLLTHLIQNVISKFVVLFVRP